MKKLRYQRHAVRHSQEQPEPLATRILSEQQAQAKTGVITSPSGSDANIRALGDANPVTSTLAGIAREALGVASLNKIAIINLGRRDVTILPTGTAFAAALEAFNGVKSGEFTKDDPTKGSSPMTDGDENALLADIISAAKPALSVESLINKIEDVYNDEEEKSAFVVVDQANAKVFVYETPDKASTEDTDLAGSFAEEAQFHQTLTGAAGTQFGE